MNPKSLSLALYTTLIIIGLPLLVISAAADDLIDVVIAIGAMIIGILGLELCACQG